MQVARCTQPSQCRVRPSALLARQSPALCRTTLAHHAFQPVTMVSLRSQRAAVIVRAADIQAAPIDVSSTEEAKPKKIIKKEGVCHLRFERGSVSKVRRILDVMRGRSYEEALNICEYMPYKACESITRVLVSAASNAKHNTGALKAKLIVAEAFADGGPNLKRMRPRAQGRAFKRLKGTFHLTIRVAEPKGEGAERLEEGAESVESA